MLALKEAQQLTVVAVPLLPPRMNNEQVAGRLVDGVQLKARAIDDDMSS